MVWLLFPVNKSNFCSLITFIASNCSLEVIGSILGVVMLLVLRGALLFAKADFNSNSSTFDREQIVAN